MSALTLRGIDETTKKALQRQASETGVSMNKLILSLIEEHVHGSPEGKPRRHHDLDDLIGSLNEADARAIEESTADGHRIDSELWQ